MVLKGHVILPVGPLGLVAEEEFTFKAIICPHCDKTHVGLTASTGMVIKLDLTEKEAEEIASKLNVPEVVHG